MSGRIWNVGDEQDAPDRSVTARVGALPVHATLQGNRKANNPLAHNDNQNDRLALLDLPKCDINICQQIMENTMHVISEKIKAATVMIAYDPKTTELLIYGHLDATALLVLSDGEKTKAIPLINIMPVKELCYDEQLSLNVPALARAHGLNVDKVKAGILIGSDGFLEKALDPTIARETARDDVAVENLLEKVSAMESPSPNLAKNIANIALKNGSTDNISVIWMPNVLAVKEGPPVIACVCDTPGEGPGAQQVINAFQRECMNAVYNRDTAQAAIYKPPANSQKTAI